MSAARHYWNASLPLINQPIERELLRDALHLMLQCISDTADKRRYRKEEVPNFAAYTCGMVPSFLLSFAG